MGKMAGRPLLQDLVKAAMVDSAGRMSVNAEAYRQETKTAGAEKCKKCGKEKCACGMGMEDKMASGAGLDQHVTKLASALDFMADLFLKEGASLSGPHGLTEHLQTSAPGVLEAKASTPLPDHKGQGVHVTPMHTGMQAARPGDATTQVPNNAAEHVHGEMQQTNYGKKSASIVDMVRAKLAQDEHEKKETEGMAEAEKGLAKAEAAHASEPENKGKKEAGAFDALAAHMASKVAEDAINPAKISAGKAVPPDTSSAEQPGGAPAGGAPKGPTKLVSSVDAARNYTKGQAYAERKKDLGMYFDEPALSAAHDNTLQVAFAHTGKAGPKIASAEQVTASPVSASVKTAAARVLLSKLASAAEENQVSGAAAQGA
jgi:hypothetical protein